MREAQAGGPVSCPFHPRTSLWRGWRVGPQRREGQGGVPPCRLLRGQLPGLLSGGPGPGSFASHLHGHSSSGHSQPPQKPLPALEKGTRPGSPLPPPVPPHCPFPEGRTMGWRGGGGGVWLGSQAGGIHCVWGPECLHSKCLGC